MGASTSPTWLPEGRADARPGSRLARDLRTIRTLVHGPHGAGDSRERLGAYYESQASDYDDFRDRLLHGREELVAALPLSPGDVWVDLGGGTGRNLDFAREVVPALGAVYIVDLATPLLDRARARAASHGWTNVATVDADATTVDLPPGVADVVTCSYSLTMMTDWTGALEHARRLLRRGGTLGVVDFYVSLDSAAPRRQHGLLTRTFWPWWFRHSGVRLNPYHLPYLGGRFSATSVVEEFGNVPYLPFRAPYYRFIGRRD
jgi:S-adenosylmethionine-diacylgycerolhomoserine-N-methlytransferase